MTKPAHEGLEGEKEDAQGQWLGAVFDSVSLQSRKARHDDSPAAQQTPLLSPGPVRSRPLSPLKLAATPLQLRAVTPDDLAP